MKRNADYILSNVADTWVVVPVAQAAEDFPGMLTLNESGRYLWELLESEQTEQSLTLALTERYEVTAQQAAADVRNFLDRLIKVGAVEPTPS